MAYGKSSGGMGSQYGRGNRLAAALAPDAAAISNIKGNTQGLAYALEKGLQGLFAGMDAKEQKMFQTGFAEAMRPDPTTTIDMGTGDESEIDGAIDTVELTNSPGYSDELEFNEDQEVIGEAREVMGAGPALSESGLRGSGVAASSPMAIPGRDLSTRLTDFLSSPGMKNNRYAGNMAMPMAMQQMSQERKLQAAQLQRQQELQDLKTKQRDKLALKNAPGSMSGKTPSSIEEWNIFSNMSKEDKDRYLLMKRANPYMNIGGSMVQPRPTQPGEVAGSIAKTIPPEQEPAFKREQTANVEAGKLAIKQVEVAFKGLNKVRANVNNLNQAIAALDAGANTGPVYKMLPSVSAASVELANIRNKLGLDVVGAVTFGALSKGELDLAMDTALPTGLNPQRLKAWLVKKAESQNKLAAYYNDAAIYLGKPGNTVSSWVEVQEAARAASGASGATATRKLPPPPEGFN